jgi:hypothetical protein
MKGLLGTVGIILLAASASFAQITFDFTGSGARAEGMGKAFIGLSDDVSAATWNPAGLIVQEKPMLGFGYASYKPRGTFKNIEADYDRAGSFGKVSMLTFIAPIRVRGHQFVGCASYSKLGDEATSANADYDFAFPFTITTTGGTFTTYYPSRATVITEYHGAPFVLNFAFGTKFYNNWSAGMSINIYTGQAVQKSAGLVSVEDFPDYSGTGMQTVTMTINNKTLDSAKFGGTNFTVGVRHSGEKLSAGLIIKTPFSLKYEHDMKLASTTAYNGLVNTQASYTIYTDNIVQKYEIPLIIGAGIGYQFSDKLLGALDVEMRNYSGKMVKVRDSIKILPGGNSEEYYHDIDLEWNNSLVIRGGVEYLKETGNRLVPTIPLRAGLAYVPLPAASVDANGALKTATEIAMSVGSGIQWSQIHLDLAYTMSSYTMEGWLGSSFDARMPHVKEQARNHHFSATFTGYF